jgi:putative transposase
MQRRKFTIEQKLNVLQQVKQMGVTRVLREHNISYSVFARWKMQFSDDDMHTANNHADAFKTEVDQLLAENNRLKKIVANLALELEVKREQLRMLRNI